MGGSVPPTTVVAHKCDAHTSTNIVHQGPHSSNPDHDAAKNAVDDCEKRLVSLHSHNGSIICEMKVNGIAAMRRWEDSWINATHILKIAGIDKTGRKEILENDIHKGEHQKVQGGYGKYQGTWIPLARALNLCCEYGLEQILQPLLAHDIRPLVSVGGVKNVSSNIYAPVRLENKQKTKPDTRSFGSNTTEDSGYGSSSQSLTSRSNQSSGIHSNSDVHPIQATSPSPRLSLGDKTVGTKGFPKLLPDGNRAIVPGDTNGISAPLIPPSGDWKPRDHSTETDSVPCIDGRLLHFTADDDIPDGSSIGDMVSRSPSPWQDPSAFGHDGMAVRESMVRSLTWLMGRRLNVEYDSPTSTPESSHNSTSRSVITLPAYRQRPSETELVLGREEERNGINVVVELPTTKTEDAIREEEMESLFQIRLARRRQIAEREERRQRRRDARGRNDIVALQEIREQARQAGSNNQDETDNLRQEHERAKGTYADLGVARHDGTRLRANSTESERVGLLSDAATRDRSASSVLSIDILERDQPGSLGRQSVIRETTEGSGNSSPGSGSGGHFSTCNTNAGIARDPSGSKRRRPSDEQGRDPGDGEDREWKRSKRANSPPGSLPKRPRFACPYQKHDAFGSFLCCMVGPRNREGGAENFARVKSHVLRNHNPFTRCRTCWRYFTTEDETQLHESASNCINKASPAKYWMTKEQSNQVKGQRFVASGEENWFHLFALVFPDIPPEGPNGYRRLSPYYVPLTPLPPSLPSPPSSLPLGSRYASSERGAAPTAVFEIQDTSMAQIGQGSSDIQQPIPGYEAVADIDALLNQIASDPAFDAVGAEPNASWDIDGLLDLPAEPNGSVLPGTGAAPNSTQGLLAQAGAIESPTPPDSDPSAGPPMPTRNTRELAISRRGSRARAAVGQMDNLFLSRHNEMLLEDNVSLQDENSRLRNLVDGIGDIRNRMQELLYHPELHGGYGESGVRTELFAIIADLADVKRRSRNADI